MIEMQQEQIQKLKLQLSKFENSEKTQQHQIDTYKNQINNLKKQIELFELKFE
jgi:archaellum component FlaC